MRVEITMVYIGFRAKFVEIRSSNEEALVWKQEISLCMEGIRHSRDLKLSNQQTNDWLIIFDKFALPASVFAGCLVPGLFNLNVMRAREWYYTYIYLAILCSLFGMVKWPLQRLSDLQIGDKKVTLNHLVHIFLFFDHHPQMLRVFNRVFHHVTLL